MTDNPNLPGHPDRSHGEDFRLPGSAPAPVPGVGHDEDADLRELFVPRFRAPVLSMSKPF